MDDMTTILITAGIIFLVAFVVLASYDTVEYVTIRARIVKKYEKHSTILMPIGKILIPMTHDDYYFEMSNGDVIKVSYSDYVKYDVGDIYEYKKRKG